MKTDLRTYNNSWYNPGNSFKRFLWMYINVIFFKSSFFPFNSLKVFLLRLFGSKIGKGVVIKPSVNIKYPWKLIVGDYVWIGEDVWIDNLDNVIIGNHTCISQGALLLCGNHNYKKSGFDLIIKPITIEDGVWIGAKSVVCGGVTCYSHSVLTVASVATNSLEAYSIYQGNPCQKIKVREITRL